MCRFDSYRRDVCPEHWPKQLLTLTGSSIGRAPDCYSVCWWFESTPVSVSKNNLEARIKEYEAMVAANRNSKMKYHKPGSQKK
jgi:hypothetical protein